jgi:hypothetical protein
MPTKTARTSPSRTSGPPARTSTRSGGASPPLWSLTVVCVLAAAAAVYGLVVDDAYRTVPELLRQTWRAQDAVTLASLPVLVAASLRARAGSFPAHVVRVGVLTWLTYAFLHLAVGTPLNDVFLLYVAVVVLAGYGMLDGLLRVDVTAVAPAFSGAPRRAAAAFLAVAGAGIAVLWLSDIAVGLGGGVPAGVHLAELPNPTWVFDLAWIIPWAVAAAVLLARRHPAAAVVTGPLLVMLTILSAAMLLTTPFGLAAGLGDDPVTAPQLVAFTVVFAVLGGVELALLVVTARRMTAPPRGWSRPGWWSVGPAGAGPARAGRGRGARS